MRFWVGFSDKMTTSEIRKNVNKPQGCMPYWDLKVNEEYAQIQNRNDPKNHYITIEYYAKNGEPLESMHTSW